MQKFTQWPKDFRSIIGWSAYAFSPVSIQADQFCLSEGPFFQEENVSYSGIYEPTGPECEISRILVESFRKVPQVMSIWAKFSDDGIAIWTLLDSYDRAARGEVYKKELYLCQSRRIYDFDFRVTSIDLVSPQQLADNGLKEIYRRQ